MRRVIVLGASNVTLGFSTMYGLISQRIAEPVQLLAAHGHGRSYGQKSQVCWRELPGIAECQLWDALSLQTETYEGTDALLTDIGNDLLYGVEVPGIVDWVETCLTRLAATQARLIVTLPPLASVQKLTERRYRFFRTILFPQSRMSWEVLHARAHELSDEITRLAQQFQATLIEPPGEWYGYDPIHVKRQIREVAWSEILGPMFSSTEPAPENHDFRRVRLSRLTSWRLRPAVRRFAGRQQTQVQPVLSFTDGSSISLY